MATRQALEVFVPSRFQGHEEGAWLRSRSDQWHALRDEYRSARGFTVPDWMFDEERRVRDHAAYVLDADGRLDRVRGGRIRRGCVALVLDAPHKEEFDGPGGCAVPSPSVGIRRDLEAELPDLLRSVPNLRPADLAGRQLVVVHAVQFQTSLHSLMRLWSSKLSDAVRNAVWKAVFQAGGGDDLLRRLDGYGPRLVLLAPTTPLRKPLMVKLREARPPWPSYRVGSHPSRWLDVPPTLLGQVTGPGAGPDWFAAD